MCGGYQILLLMEFILIFRGDADILTLDFPKQIENEDQIVQIFEDAAIRYKCCSKFNVSHKLRSTGSGTYHKFVKFFLNEQKLCFEVNFRHRSSQIMSPALFQIKLLIISLGILNRKPCTVLIPG